MSQLRDKENGCEWDKEQTFETIAPHTIEEAYEVADAIERSNKTDLKEELGDLLLQVVFLSQIAKEEKSFEFNDVVQVITDKLIRRHPYVFSKKKNLRILSLSSYKPKKISGKEIAGGWVIQETDLSKLKTNKLKTVTKKAPTKAQLSTLKLAWKTVKHTKSNAIVVAHNKKIISISGGQTSRVDAVRYALTKAQVPAGSVLASDAFFPFRDSVDLMGKYKIKSVIQPGGSIKDSEVISACDEHKISMVFTGTRVFKH